METFSSLLKKYKEESCLTYREISEFCSVHHTYIMMLTRPKYKKSPSREIVLELCEALELDSFESNKLLVSAGFAPMQEWTQDYQDVYTRGITSSTQGRT